MPSLNLPDELVAIINVAQDKLDVADQKDLAHQDSVASLSAATKAEADAKSSMDLARQESRMAAQEAIAALNAHFRLLTISARAKA